MKIALVGNPNSGKTTLFNSLTNSSQYVGNWPGVTVEKKEGNLKKHKDVTIVDLPGIYSLSPYTLEEVVARNYLVNEKPDVIINIVDATNLERNLYLSTQLMDMKLPMIIALNMMDVVNKSQDKINIEKLKEHLNLEIVEISALKNKGIDILIEKTLKLAETKEKAIPIIFNKTIENSFDIIKNTIKNKVNSEDIRWYTVKLFELDDKIIKDLNLTEEEKNTIKIEVNKNISNINDDSESIITNARYQFISETLKDCFIKDKKSKKSTSDKIDEIVTNRFLGLPIFALVIFVVYFLAINWPGGLLTDFVNDVIFGDSGIPYYVQTFLENINCASWLQSLIVNGIIAGVGAILGFLPQMMVLFLLLAILEDCGYMSRIAFVLDRVFRKFGLSGKSFIPMLISTGCGVPGVMASRTIENEADRRMTIVTTTFMPCGAKLPIIALIAGALFSDAWWVAPSAYFIGIGAVIITGIMLKKTKWFMGDPAPFIMELPSYHLPLLKGLGIHVYDRTKAFVKKAGTIILLATVFVWLLSSFTYKFEYIDTWKNTSKIENINIEEIINNANVSSSFDRENDETDLVYTQIVDEKIYVFVRENGEEIYMEEVTSVNELLNTVGIDNKDKRKQIRVALDEEDNLVYSYDLSIDNSLLANISTGLNYLFIPIGFDNWKATAATVTGLIAKENVVGTLGVIYGMESVSENGTEIWARVATDFTKLSAFSFLVFNLLCAPCFAAIGAIKREMGNKKWTIFAILYQTIFAYLIAFTIYQIGNMFVSGFNILSLLGIIVFLGLLYLVIRPDLMIKKKRELEI